jgi:hypothetical protein
MNNAQMTRILDQIGFSPVRTAQNPKGARNAVGTKIIQATILRNI